MDVMFGSRRKVGNVEEVGIIRRTIQDVLVPEMQGIKERLVTHDEKLATIEKRLDRIDSRLDILDADLRRGFAALGVAIERIEARLSFSELDKRLEPLK